jgi:Predicted Zn-dependent peptidases
MVAVNVLYDVGAKDEHPDKTGFAHLFEHLMFGGSINIPNYDEPLQDAGEKIMLTPPTILPIITYNFLHKILKRPFG